jgi:hypothetical protein
MDASFFSSYAADATPRARSWRATCLGLTLIGVLFAIQAALFLHHVRRQVAPLYPVGFDQSVYLTMSYRIYEEVGASGWQHGLWEGLKAPLPNGMLLHVQAAVVHSLLRPSRLAALLPNFAYFALFQCVLAATLLWLSGRWSVAILGVGLLLLAGSPHILCGGMLDFRIDFIAFCLFGIFTCVVVRSRIFASLPLSFLAGCVAAVLFMFRFITIVHLAAILGTCFAILCLRMYWLRRDALARSMAGRQIIGVLAASLVVSAVAIPVLIWKFQPLWDYYVVNYVIGGDREIRAREYNVDKLVNALAFYPKSVLIDHAGRYFMVAALAVLNVVLLAGLWYRRSMVRRLPFSYGFFIISLLVPLAVLTAIVSKSPVVGNVLLPSLLWLMLLPIAQFSAAKPSGTVPTSLLFGLAAVLVACSIGLSAHQYKSLNGWTARAPEASEVARLYETLASHVSRDRGAKAPSISVDCIKDCLCPLAMTAGIYERDRIFLDFKPQLGFGIMAVTEADAYANVKESDFVVLSDNPPPTTSFYPFDHCMEELRPKLRAFCDSNYTLLERVQLLDRKLLLYMRPGADASATTAQR